VYSITKLFIPFSATPAYYRPLASTLGSGFFSRACYYVPDRAIYYIHLSELRWKAGYTLVFRIHRVIGIRESVTTWRLANISRELRTTRHAYKHIPFAVGSYWNFRAWGYTILLRLFCLRRGVYRVLVGKPERKRPLGRPRRRWEDNIKRDLQEVVCGICTGSSCLRIGTDGGHL